MAEKHSEDKKSYKSLNFYVVMFVLLVMAMSGVICIIIFNILDALFYIRSFYVIPMLLPFIAICSSIIIGSLLTALLAGTFLKPLNELKKGMKKVSEGDFSARISEISKNSELSELQGDFNGMVQELQNTELFRNDFINDFSHEFKTPMVSIHGFAKQLKKGGLTKEQEDEYIDIILAESQRLINMSSNVLLLNKLENQEIISDRATFDLAEEIRRSILMLEQQWTDKNIEINPDLDDMNYYGSAEMLRHVWLNVIGNAIKYTGENGRIDISLKKSKKSENELVVSVSDNGIGMDKQTAEHIFEKFYQGDSSHATGGNGLGLAMVKRIVTLCNGRIRVKSEQGKGTQFYIFLPIVAEKPEEEKKKKSLPSIDTAGLKTDNKEQIQDKRKAGNNASVKEHN